MQALMLLFWTGALLGHSSCQDSSGSPQEVSAGGGGVGNPSPSLAGSMGDGTDTRVPGQALAFMCT